MNSLVLLIVCVAILGHLAMSATAAGCASSGA